MTGNRYNRFDEENWDDLWEYQELDSEESFFDTMYNHYEIAYFSWKTSDQYWEMLLNGNSDKRAIQNERNPLHLLLKEETERYSQKQKETKDSYTTISRQMARSANKSAVLKKVYEDTCQVCGTRMKLTADEYYSETHHIHPRAEGGGDELENMLVLCSNCHKMFDRSTIMIDLKTGLVFHQDPSYFPDGKKIFLKHNISGESVDYNNKKFMELQKAVTVKYF